MPKMVHSKELQILETEGVLGYKIAPLVEFL